MTPKPDVAAWDSYRAVAAREAPGLGMPVQTLTRHLHHTRGDLEGAINRYLKFREDGGAKPVTWQDRTFPTRQGFHRLPRRRARHRRQRGLVAIV